jgi:hypothetical protein
MLMGVADGPFRLRVPDVYGSLISIVHNWTRLHPYLMHRQRHA